MLWLALNLRQLALEVFPAMDQPCAVVAQQMLVAVNASAAAAGLQPSMRLALALGLAPNLSVQARAAQLESVALHNLACWAGQFSPHIHIASDAELMLEIGGCLRLFKGVDNLCNLVREGASTQGFTAAMAVAPTPLAAQYLARTTSSDQTLICQDRDECRALIASLDVGVLGLKAPQTTSFETLGCQVIGDLLALPSAGLARRFGTDLPLKLAQACGDVPDLRSAFVFPDQFKQRLELPAKIEASEMLLFGARRMLAALSGWLAARAAGVHQCILSIEHEDGVPASQIVLAFASATRDLARMQRVLQERLAHFPLPAPAVLLELRADDPQTLAGATLGLFGESQANALDPVIERLRARLGAGAVHGVGLRADHRPECASHPLPEAIAFPAHPTPAAARPMWLLPQPRSLAEIDGRPAYGGNLLRLAGPERIESGWWDEVEANKATDVRRDYYVAVSPQGEWLWIFRDARGWCLHGYFA